MSRRMSPEHRLIDKLTDALIREDFNPDLFAYVFRNCSALIQKKMFKVVLGLIRHWSIDFDNGEFRDSDDYTNVVTNARRLQDSIDRFNMYL